MTSRAGWRALLLGAGILLLAACGTAPSSTSSQDTPLLTSPSPAPTQLKISVGCGGPFHAGQYVPLVCIATVWDTPSNPVRGVYADFSVFGRSAQYGAVECPACGPPPRTFDLDLRIPADMTPGVRTFAAWAIFADGSRVDTTASIEIAGPPSQLTASARCVLGPVHPGQTVDCTLWVQDVNYPQEQRFDVWADLRIFDGPAEVQASLGCPGCGGGPPWAYSVKVSIPANITPGVKTFPVWAGTVYAGPKEHRADTTGSIQIVVP